MFHGLDFLLRIYYISIYPRKKCKGKKKKKKKEDIGNIEYFDYMQGIKDPLKNIIISLSCLVYFNFQWYKYL
jgi:hypothetical protein